MNTWNTGDFYGSETTKTVYGFSTVLWVCSPNPDLFMGELYSVWYCNSGYMTLYICQNP